MLGLGRNGLRKIASRRAFSAAVQAAHASNNNNSNSGASTTSSIETRKFTNNNNFKKPFTQSTPVEQIRLQKKYKEHLDNNKLETLHEAIEYVEWRGTVFPQTMVKIVELLESSPDLASLSDRQLAVILSAFGANCDTLSRSKRAAHLSRVEEILKKKGVNLGLQSLNTLVECKIDNRSQLDAVEELRKFEDYGVEADAKTYALICEIYAKQANTKAITDIIGFMKSNNMPLSEDHVTQLIYSIAKSGNDAQVTRVVEAFSNSMNVVRLRCAAARAIIQREKEETGRGAFEAIEMLRAIPSTAKLHSIDNNVYVLNVLMDLIEVGQLDAFNLLSSFLILSRDGNYLSENHLNLALVARAKSILCEGNLTEAMTLYSCANPAFSNEFFVRQFKQNLDQQLKTVTNENFDQFLATLTLAQKKGIISDVNHFLLISCAYNSLPEFLKIFEHVKNAKNETHGELRRILAENPGLKRHLAKQFAHLLIKSTSPSQQARYLANIATILFAPVKEETAGDTFANYATVFKMSNQDVKLAIPALNFFEHRLEKKEFATAIVDQLLRSLNDDHLAFDKLTTFLESGKIEQLNSHRMRYSLLKFFISGGNAEIDAVRTKLTAKMIALDFATDSRGNKFAAHNLATFLSNEMISDEKADQLITALEAEKSASLSNEELAEAKEVLKENTKKADMLYRLKKSQTASRWNAAEVEDLIKELASFKPDSPIGVVMKLREVILKKALDKKEDLSFLVRVLEQASEWVKEEKSKGNDDSRLKLQRSTVKKLVRDLEATTLSKALISDDLVLADRIWLMKSGSFSADVLLSYAAKLFLNEKVERVDEVCENLRTTAQQILPVTLEKVGRRLKGSDPEKVNQLASYFKSKFNLTEKSTGRIVMQVKLDKLEEIIKSGKLDEALRMAVEETRANNRAFGQLPIMIEAIKTSNVKVLESVHLMVRNAHQQDVANLNLAYALLHCNHVQRAKNLVEKQNLEVDDKVLQYFIILASSSSDSATTLKNLFSVFNGRASTLQLNSLLESLTRILWRSEDFESLRKLDGEISATSFPLENKLRKSFDALKLKYSTELE